MKHAPLGLLLVLALAMLACNPLAGLMATPTPTATDTPTPTLTPIPTDTPTPTPVPTDTPVPTETAAAATAALLSAEDLPAGFQEIPPEEFGFGEDSPFAEGGGLEHTFAFFDPTLFEIVFGFTMPLETRVDQLGFDTALGRPDLFSDYFGQILGEQASDVTVLEGLDGIGDSSGGFTMLMDLGTGFNMRVDMAMARLAEQGVLVLSMYVDGEQPSVPIADLAQIAADRLAALP